MLFSFACVSSKFLMLQSKKFLPPPHFLCIRSLPISSWNVILSRRTNKRSRSRGQTRTPVTQSVRDVTFSHVILLFQVQTGYKCACILRDTISPYLLRRMKQDVQSHIKLPEKSDQVLFCSLTDHQIEVYEKYLRSDAVHSILIGTLKVTRRRVKVRKKTTWNLFMSVT